MTVLAQRPPLPTATATPAARVAFPLLTRVGGLPAGDLDLVAARTRTLLEQDADATERTAAAADVLVDALFAVVPRLDDDVVLRRRVLAGKRAAHRSLPLPWDDAETDRVRALLGPDGARVGDYTSALQGSDRARADLVEQLAEDRRAGLEHLTAAVRRTGFLESLVMAAPDWVRWARPSEQVAHSPKDIKTLVSYVARAAVKTSPFSGLTTVGVAGEQGAGRARSRTTAVLALQALGRLAADPATAPLLRYRPCTLREGGPDEPGGLALVSELVAADGIVWRDDRVVEADAVRPWLDLLGDPGPAGLGLAEILGLIGGEDPFARFQRLLGIGVLRALTPWRRGEDPLAVLATLVAPVSSSPVPAAVLHTLAASGAAAAGASAVDRLSAAERMDRAAAALTPDDGAHRPSGLVYEDRESDLLLSDPRRLPSVAEDLDLLAARVRPQVFRSHVYDLLVDRFVAAFGAGGSTTDVVGFLMRQAVERDQDPALQRAQASDLTARHDPGERAWLPVGATSAPPSVGVLFQVGAGTGPGGRERPSVVVNNFGSGSGALFARFSSLLGDRFGQDLTRGVRDLWDGVPCRELTVWTDCNTAQAECSGLLPPLLVPGEPDAADGLRLEDTVLRHDRGSGTLSLTTRDGDVFGLPYLGLTPRHLLQGYLRFLAVIADPWINASDDSDYTLTKYADLAPRCGPGVVALPRVQEGSLVTRRASWLVPRELMPEVEDVDDLTLARRARDFRAEHGLPEEVFVSQLGGLGAPMGGSRKPIWASLASPLSLRVLRQSLSAGASHLRVVEALPGRAAYPQLDRDGRPVVTEHCALLHWSKPGRNP